MSTPKNNAWYYPTNQLNLAFNLAQSMIVSPDDYMGAAKYYSDWLARYPGWLPLFSHITSEHLQEVVSDQTFLNPVVLEIDLQRLKGQAKATTGSDDFQDILLPDALNNQYQVLLLPLPLPVPLVKKIWFPDPASKNDFLERARTQYRNVSLEPTRLGSKKLLFQSRKKESSLALESTLTLPSAPSTATGISKASALGCIRTMLFRLGHRWKLANDYYEWLFLDGQNPPKLDPILTNAKLWMQQAGVESRPEVKLFWSLVDALVEGEVDGREHILQMLGQELEREGMDEKAAGRLRDLVNDLEGLSGLGGKTIEVLLQQYTKPFSRALLLFFTHDSSESLMAFRFSGLEQQDYLAAMLLLAAYQGWLGLPDAFRNGMEFVDETSQFMVQWLHRQNGIDFTWDTTEKPLRPLYYHLAPEASSLREEKQREAKRLEIARSMKWDCIETFIQLAPGEYPLHVSKAGVEIKFSGEPKAVTTVVRQQEFFDKLASADLPDKLIQKLA